MNRSVEYTRKVLVSVIVTIGNIGRLRKRSIYEYSGFKAIDHK